MLTLFRTGLCVAIATLLVGACRELDRSDDRSVAFPTDSGAAAYYSVTELDLFSVPWYANAVRAMREPPTRSTSLPPETTVLRFVYLRSFHNGLAALVTPEPRGCDVTTSEARPWGIEISPALFRAGLDFLRIGRAMPLRALIY